MSTYFVHKEEPDHGFYKIEQDADTGRWRWHWHEVSTAGITYDDFGKWVESEAEALYAAADDWENNGDSLNRRFTGMLRGLAKRVDGNP